MTLGERISQARKLRGLTLDEIARAVGVHKSTIQRYEKDEYSSPKLPVIESIARALAVNPSWLVGQSDNMTPATGTDDGRGPTFDFSKANGDQLKAIKNILKLNPAQAEALRMMTEALLSEKQDQDSQG